MVYGQTTTVLDANVVIREGVAIAGILLLWMIFAAVSLFIADLAPRHSWAGPLFRGFAWVFGTVGLANVVIYILLKTVAYHHALREM